MDAKVFSDVPNELKTVEIDAEKNIFKVNGVPFGDGCTSFSISCEAAEGFRIRMEMDTTVKLASYEMSGKKISDRAYENFPESKERNTLQSIDSTLKRIEAILLALQKTEHRVPLTVLKDAVAASLSQHQEHVSVLHLNVPDLSRRLEWTDSQTEE